MAFHELKEDGESFLTGQRYTQAIRMALIFVLLGGGFLAMAKFLHWPNGSVMRFLLARIAEILGWVFLVSSTAVLFSEWRLNRRSPPIRPYPGDRSRLFRIPAARDVGMGGTKREEAIDRLYSELRPLLSRAATDPSLREEAQGKLALLRKLQDEEADEIEKRFESGLLLKPGEGYRALERAREILARYEDPPPAHAATQQED